MYNKKTKTRKLKRRNKKVSRTRGGDLNLNQNRLSNPYKPYEPENDTIKVDYGVKEDLEEFLNENKSDTIRNMDEILRKKNNLSKKTHKRHNSPKRDNSSKHNQIDFLINDSNIDLIHLDNMGLKDKTKIDDIKLLLKKYDGTKLMIIEKNKDKEWIKPLFYSNEYIFNKIIHLVSNINSLYNTENKNDVFEQIYQNIKDVDLQLKITTIHLYNCFDNDVHADICDIFYNYYINLLVLYNILLNYSLSFIQNDPILKKYIKILEKYIKTTVHLQKKQYTN